MNANADNHATATASSDTTTATVSNAIIKRHQENKTFKHIQTPKKATNMTQYLSKYLDKINEISQYNINIDEMDGWNETYKYDEEFKTEKEINKFIIRLIIDMFYNLDNENSLILRLKIKYMIDNKFNYPFLIIEEKEETGTFYNIYDIFKYIKRTIKGKNGDKLFNKIKDFKCEFIPEIKAEPLKQEFKCAVCLEDKEYPYIINFNCQCRDLICQGCFNTLPQPKKCPLCRKTPYKLNLTVAEDEPPKRKFMIKYNNKSYEEFIKISKLEDETVYYFDTQKEKIKYFKMQLKTDEELIAEVIEDDDNFFSFCCYRADLYYLYHNAKTDMTENIIKVCIDATYKDEMERWEFIDKVLGLENISDRRDFIQDYANANGANYLSEQIEENYKDEFIFMDEDGGTEKKNVMIDFYGDGATIDFRNLFYDL